MRKWIKNVCLKTIKTMAQAAMGVISGSALVQDVRWEFVLSTVAIAGISCVLFNVSNIETED